MLFSRKCPFCKTKLVQTTIADMAAAWGFLSVDDYQSKDWGQIRLVCPNCKTVEARS